MKPTDLIDQLRRASVLFAGEHLPIEIRYQDRYGNLVIKPLLEATVDELVFAAQLLNAERSILSRRVSALEDVHAYARRRCYLGADRIGDIAEEVKK